ncbi:hypothetical protein ABLN72_15910, partial [Mycobacterium tuberculosis]
IASFGYQIWVFSLQASQHFHCFRIYRETLSRFSCAHFTQHFHCFRIYPEKTLSRFSCAA